LAYESAMADVFDATVFVSEEEANFFKELVPEVADKVIFRVHGVDSQFFDPALSYDSPYSAEKQVLVFAGAMDYWPNVHAAVWFAEEVFPRIREQSPGTCFYIVGMNPAEEVLKLADQPGVMVTGSVPDIRPYIAHATISVAPLRIARGIQNKVLEAMAMAKPILATENAMCGIRSYSGFSPVIVETAEQMVDEAVDLLQHIDKQHTQKARECVLEHYNWDTNLRRIDVLLTDGL
jgi:sugar transferase (PEP-CTERM/EpsH1 system associated)